MISPADIVKLWPDTPRYQMIALLAQELALFSTPCGNCDNSHMELPSKDCCVYDKANLIVSKLEQLEKERQSLEVSSATPVDISAAISAVSARAAARQLHATHCLSDRSRKHMQIRADEAGQIVAELRKLKEPKT